jgi:capsule polysaccharide export protein KpsE/RkpR
MKLHSLLLLTAAIVIPTVSSFAMPAEARGVGQRLQGNRAARVDQTTTVAQNANPSEKMRGDRGNLTPEQRQAKQAEREAKMKAELGLSDAQAAQMKAVRTKYEPQHKALRAEAEALKAGGATREQIKAALGEKRKALHDQMKAEIKGILTPEQLAKMEAMKGDRGGQGGGRGAR